MGRVARSETVVHVDHRDTGRARVEHRQQRRQRAEVGTVPHARRHGDHGPVDEPADHETRRQLHRTIAAVRDDMAELKFNTAIARLFEFNNHLTQVVAERGGAPRDVVEPLVLMLAPLTPHVGEELWRRLGHDESLTYESFPMADPAELVQDTVEIPVEVNGKVRARVTVVANISDADIEAAARAEPRIAALLEGVEVRKVVVVPGRLVGFVTS